jgi:type I restriction enzyme M protein
MREVLEKFDFGNTITKLDDAGLLFKVVERFKTVDLHPHYARSQPCASLSRYS